jgi:hypothetical protein
MPNELVGVFGTFVAILPCQSLCGNDFESTSVNKAKQSKAKNHGSPLQIDGYLVTTAIHIHRLFIILSQFLSWIFFLLSLLRSPYFINVVETIFGFKMAGHVSRVPRLKAQTTKAQFRLESHILGGDFAIGPCRVTYIL